MGRNQHRIEGEYAIVSVYKQDRGAVANASAHDTAAMSLLDAGAVVEFLKGRWDGTDEQSLRVHGPLAGSHAFELATKYDQQAFIVVSGGVATVWVWAVDNYYPAITYNAIEECDGATTNYSETRQGFRFRFTNKGGV